jgi:ADP-ribose pyrophosphatase
MRRPRKPRSSAVDAVMMVVILDKPTGPELLLEKQYRPPVDKVVVEMPAGLVDEGESSEVAAVRELREETGFVGEVVDDRRAGGSERRPIFYSCEY